MKFPHIAVLWAILEGVHDALTRRTDLATKQHDQVLDDYSTSIFHLSLAIITLFAVPLIVTDNLPASFTEIRVVWEGLLHASLYLAVSTSCLATSFQYTEMEQLVFPNARTASKRLFVRSTIVAVLISAVVLITSSLQMVFPSWLWNPFLVLTSYRVYTPDEIAPALQGICLDDKSMDGSQQEINLFAYQANDPLCLSAESWQTLSAGVLSSKNKNDVQMVRRGAQFAKKNGLILNILARDAVDAVPALRLNVEGLVPFFSKISVVIFENDSADGTREKFKQWAAEAHGYHVDLIRCDDNPDCKLGVKHRYEHTNDDRYMKRSAIGKMAEYRQRIVDYIVAEPTYLDYSHMMVLDYDLALSLSPLGILHTLGKLPHNPVACSGRLAFPGSLGTLLPPYDIGAFRVKETPSNRRLLKLQSLFCGVRPPDDRWQNFCEAPSPFQFTLVHMYDRLHANGDPYPVNSAFNGAALYPLSLVRKFNATYDAGEHGQRNEHIGFHYSLHEQMFVNPKWELHLNPAEPAGASGMRAFRIVTQVLGAGVGALIALQVIFSYMLFCYPVSIVYFNFEQLLAAATSSVWPKKKKRRAVLPLVHCDDSESIVASPWSLAEKREKFWGKKV